MLADISGFTKFMRSQIISISHSKQVIVRLLKTIIKASRSPLKIAELEGDAVFFYAVCNEKNTKEVISQVKLLILNFFNAFEEEIKALTGLDACSCEACKRTRDLKLKVVVHIGDVQFEKINRSEKLFGLDVIIVHRMLKNSVPSNEYIMISEYAHPDFVDFHGFKYEKFSEEFEGIGKIDTVVFYPEKQIAEKLVQKKYSILDRLIWKSILTKNTAFDWLGINKIKGTFKHNS